MKFSLRQAVAHLRTHEYVSAAEPGRPAACRESAFFVSARRGLDEAQHLHVIYGWLSGGLPYRDIFDNHTPLFHWLFLPFARLAGETPEVVLLARLAQIPISFGVLGIFYLLGCRFTAGSRRCGRSRSRWRWPNWSLKALEFRPDVLWTALWFSALFVLARAPGGRVFFVAGLLLGTALMASVKTTFLLAALGLGWAGVWDRGRPSFENFIRPGELPGCALSGGAGFLIVPGLFLAWFASQYALEAMKYCLLTVNQPDAPTAWRVVIFGFGAPCALALSWWIKPWRKGHSSRIFLTAAFYALLVIGFSPTLKKQTFLPVYPLLALAAAGEIRRVWGGRAPWMEGAVCLAFWHIRWRKANRGATDMPNSGRYCETPSRSRGRTNPAGSERRNHLPEAADLPGFRAGDDSWHGDRPAGAGGSCAIDGGGNRGRARQRRRFSAGDAEIHQGSLRAGW